jgi:hypothetical protein
MPPAGGTDRRGGSAQRQEQGLVRERYADFGRGTESLLALRWREIVFVGT